RPAEPLNMTTRMNTRYQENILMTPLSTQAYAATNAIATPRTRLPKLSVLLALLWVLAGCAVGPEYQRPSVTIPSAYKEAPSDQPLPAHEAGTWQAAQPAEQTMRGQWWTLFGDDTLNALQREAQQANQSLRAAAARLEQAR